MRDLHATFAWVVVISNGIAGVWALGAHWLEPLRGRPLWIFTAVAQCTIAGQIILGVVVMTTDDLEVEQFHMFYGFIALVGVGLLYSYRHQLAEHRYLLYGGGGLFLMGLAIRAMTIDPVPA
ncbi:MAG: hypothetical protein OES57_03620 [Acidimicrobiia bacterium]|nr:hypothetical protein [Acidimicrobiia bacterium]